MTLGLARALVRLAASLLGAEQREWGLAMQAEFGAAADDGKALSFGAGCFAGALRGLPAHEEGRFVLATYVLAVGLILPAAGLMLTSIMAGIPGVHPGNDYAGSAQPLLTEANLSAIPSLALLMLLLAGAHLCIAWSMLDRNWRRVASVARMTGAITVTLAVFSGLVFNSNAGLVHAAVGAIELTGILVLASWHAELAREPGS